MEFESGVTTRPPQTPLPAVLPAVPDPAAAPITTRTISYNLTFGSSASLTETVEQSGTTSVTVQRTVTDYSDGSGDLYNTFGTVLYVAKQVNLKVTRDWSESTYEALYEQSAEFESADQTGGSSASGSSTRGGTSGSASFKEQYAANSLVARYTVGTPTPIAHSMTLDPQPILLDLTPNTTDWIVPGSLRFTWMGTTYDDFEGVIYRGRTDTNPGVQSGVIDYTTGLAWMTDPVPGASPAVITIDSLWTRNGPQEPAASIAFNTEIAPVRPAGLVVSVVDTAGVQLVATADMDGLFGESHIYGRVDYESGLVELQFGDYVADALLTADDKAEWWYDAADITDDETIWRPWPVLADTLRYNVVGYTYLPLPADIIGVDAVRLPQDGRVPIYQPGDVAIVMHTDTTAPATVANSDTINCGRSRLGWVRVIGADGESYPTGYTLDRATGIVTFTDVSGMAQPVSVRHTVADLRVIKDAQINGALEFTRPLSHAFPADETVVGSCLLHGDRRARVSAVWDQTTWTGVWADNIIGSEATATLDLIAHPIEVTNEGAVSERWFLRWTSTVNVELIGQTRGLVFSGPFTADIAPINPATRNPDGTGGVPYLRIPVAANGGGWSTGNVVRINTVGAEAPIWMARAIQQSEEPAGEGEDGCEIYCLGNVDRP